MIALHKYYVTVACIFYIRPAMKHSGSFFIASAKNPFTFKKRPVK